MRPKVRVGTGNVAAWLAAGLALLAAPRALATEIEAPAVDAAPALTSVIIGSSACPTPEAVWAELGTLVPRDRLQARLRALAPEAARVEIQDLGLPYRVIAAGRVREYRDENRDCGYRARIAAVFVALAIDPAEIGASTPEPLAPPPPVVVAESASEPVRSLLRLEVGGVIDAGLGRNDQVAQGGVALRAIAGRGRVAAAAGIVALVPVDTSVGGVRLHQQRFPFDAGVRAHLARSRFDPYGELGLSIAWLSERALDLVTSRSGSSLEIGARGALGMRLPFAGRVSLFGAVHAAIVPRPPEIFALPRGVAGNTPFVWLGATLGASVGLL